MVVGHRYAPTFTAITDIKHTRLSCASTKRGSPKLIGQLVSSTRLNMERLAPDPRRQSDRMEGASCCCICSRHQLGPIQTAGDVRYRVALERQADMNRPSQFMSTRPRPSSATGSTMSALDQSAD